MNLQINRYNVAVPTAVTDSGLTISTPFYVSPTVDQRKQLLNAFRVIKNQQLLEMGYTNTTDNGTLKVVDNTKPPLTPIEQELGMDETNLRMAIFSRTGLQERVVMKLQKLTDTTLFSREEVENTLRLWLDNLYEHNTVPTAPKKRSTATKRKTKASAAK